MQSFRQSNPIDNIYELKENIELTKERLIELDDRLYEQIPLMLEIPPIRQLVVLNLELVLKYFKLQIILNQFLNKKMGDFIIANFYFNFIIDLNTRYELKIERMLSILKNEEKDEYAEIIELIKMYSLPFYLAVLGTNMPKLSAKDVCIAITKNIDDITLDPEKIKKGLQSMSEKIQSQITHMEANVSDIVNKVEIPKLSEIDTKFDELTSSLQSNIAQSNLAQSNLAQYNQLQNQGQNQGQNRKSRTKLPVTNTNYFKGGYKTRSFQSIYDPVHNKWVKTNSARGINLINTYVVNLIQEI